ncbi:MAG: protein disulfide oxidoreductase [bacterium]
MSPKKSVSLKKRVIRLSIQATLLLLVFFLAKTWMQRDLITGAAPELNSKDIAGELVSLDQYRGQPMLLHFWATWCPVCKLEEGAISSVAKHWPVVTVAMQSGSDEEVEKFLKVQGLDWRTVADEAGLLADQYGVTGVPVSFVIDKDGAIDFREMGYSTSWGLRLRLWLSKVFS